MLGTERQARILDWLAKRRFASSESLASELGVSVETIRRDIRQLDGRQALHRVRGGAVAAPAVAGEALFEDRSVMHQEAKQAIAGLAAGLVSAGQTVFLDLGTTALQVARALATDFVGTVATTSLLVAGELAGLPGIEVLVCGGRVRAGDLGCSNADAVRFFAGMYADVAFVGSGGLDADHGLTDYHLDEVATRRQMMAHARRGYVLADASKFDAIAPYVVCGLDDIDGLISETVPPPPLAEAIVQRGGQIITPQGHARPAPTSSKQ